MSGPWEKYRQPEQSGPWSSYAQKPTDWRARGIQIAQEEGVDPDLFDRMIQQESGWDPKAVSKAGAKGLGQLMDGTAKDLGVTDPFDPEQNLRGSARYLAQQIKEFKTPELALAAYNSGPGTVRKSGNRIPNIQETREYVKKITGRKDAQDFFREDLKKAPWLERQLVGAGGAMVEGWEGLKGLVGQTDEENVDFTRIAQQEAPVGSIVGNVAMMAPTMAIPGVNTVRGAAGVNALYNAIATPGGLAERRNSALAGAAGGAAGQYVSNALSRGFKPAEQAANILENEGIFLTPGQHAGGIWKNLEDKATSIPFLGDAIISARRRGVEDFNKAAINRAKLPGMDVDGIGHSAIQDLRQGLGASFDDIASRSSIPGPDQEFLQSMVNLGQMAQALPKQEAEEFVRVIQRELVERMGPNGQINGKNINDAIAGIRNRAEHFNKSPDGWQRDLGAALDEAQGEVFALMERTNPQLAAELLRTKKAYANFKTLQRAASGVGTETGIFTPAQLHGAVRVGDKTKDRRAFSEGTALLQDLTDPAKKIMPSKIPDSGTAGRLAANVMNPLQWPGIAGGAIAALPALAMYSRPGGKVANALYDSIANSGNPNALRLIMDPVFRQQLE